MNDGLAGILGFIVGFLLADGTIGKIIKSLTIGEEEKEVKQNDRKESNLAKRQ